MASDRLTRLNWIVAIVFAVGGALFAAGAWISQVGSGDAVTIASVYLVGVFCFVGGAYGSLLLAANGATGADGRWRWWSYRPLEIGWVATFVLFCGALAFVVSVGSSLIGALGIPPQERLVWAPDMVGRIFFLIAGVLGVIAFHERGSPWVQPRRRGWWIATVNLLGAVLFNVGGLSALVGLATASATTADISNWATFGGGIAFTLAGVLQAFHRPVGELLDARAPLPL